MKSEHPGEQPAPTDIAEIMQAYAEDALGYAERRFNVKLDFSERSLEDVDRILSAMRSDQPIALNKLSESEQENLWVFCKLLGGYVGEVIIRNLGGQWQIKEAADGSSAVKLLVKGGVEGSPPEAVWRALTEDFKSIVGYYRGLRVALGHGKRTTEDGARTVTLPPLSGQPAAKPADSNRPWWKLW